MTDMEATIKAAFIAGGFTVLDEKRCDKFVSGIAQALLSAGYGKARAKRLEWGETSYGKPEAITNLGVYRLGEAWSGGWSACRGKTVLYSSDGRSNFATEEDAQAACQSDFEKRLSECMEPAPVFIGVDRSYGSDASVTARKEADGTYTILDVQERDTAPVSDEPSTVAPQAAGRDELAQIVYAAMKRADEMPGSPTEWVPGGMTDMQEVALCAADDILSTFSMHLTLPASEGAGGWMPIETAPKDGTWVLLRSVGPDSGCVVASWDSDWCDGWWVCDDGKCAIDLPLRGPDPTHWQPLPQAPEEGGK